MGKSVFCLNHAYPAVVISAEGVIEHSAEFEAQFGNDYSQSFFGGAREWNDLKEQVQQAPVVWAGVRRGVQGAIRTLSFFSQGEKTGSIREQWLDCELLGSDIALSRDKNSI